MKRRPALGQAGVWDRDRCSLPCEGATQGEVEGVKFISEPPRRPGGLLPANSEGLSGGVGPGFAGTSSVLESSDG